MPFDTFSLAQYDEAADFLRAQTRHQPTIGVVLGSGLSALADEVRDADAIPFAAIPHFPVSTVAGHSGRLVLGELAGACVAVMQGRIHYYEGYSMQQVTFPVRVMQRLGIRTLILTNAAGGLNPTFGVGDVMVIEDHINLLGMAGINPLRGPNLEAFGTRFPAANRIYTKGLRDLTQRVAAGLRLPIRHGIYVALAGPNFESPAEIRMWRMLGADAAGMSTVPEALVAHHAGMEVLALSTITNVAIDELDAAIEPTHAEVIAAGSVIVPKLRALLLALLGEMG